MTPTEQLKAIMTEKHTSENGKEYKVKLKPGLTDKQIDELAKDLPTGQISNEIRELLKFASGFEFYGLNEVTFDGVEQFGIKGKQSNLDIIHEVTVMDIWSKNNGFIDKPTALASTDEKLKSFAATLPDNFVIADLRDTPLKSGFAWGKFGPNIDKAKRHDSELIWGLEKKGLLSRLFGK